MAINRINYQTDFILSIVRVSENWKPNDVYDVPSSGELLSQTPVASFDEAHDDLVRCNALALKYSWNEWAVIQTAKARINRLN